MDDEEDAKEEPDEDDQQVKKDEPDDEDGEGPETGNQEDNDIRDMKYKLENLSRTVEQQSKLLWPKIPQNHTKSKSYKIDNL